MQFFPKFGEASCEQTCAYSQIPEQQIRGIMRKEVTLVSACQVNNYLLISFDEQALNNSAAYFDDTMTFTDLNEMESEDVRYMYIAGTDFKSPDYNGCWMDIKPGGIGNETLNGVVFIEYDDYTWEWPASGWYLILSIIMALFFILIEWLFYSYNEIMIPRKDYRAYIMWYIIRIGWMSYMFAIVIAHSLLINDDITYIVGDFGYIWVKADCYIATGFIGLFILICLCCCCFQESMSSVQNY